MFSAKKQILFQYVKNLYEIEQEEGLKFANHLSFSHIKLQDKKMKVALTVQTIHNQQ